MLLEIGKKIVIYFLLKIQTRIFNRDSKQVIK